MFDFLLDDDELSESNNYPAGHISRRPIFHTVGVP